MNNQTIRTNSYLRERFTPTDAFKITITKTIIAILNVT